MQSDAALESTVSNALLIDVTIDSPIAIQMRDVCVQVTVLYARVVFRDSPEILKKLGKEMKNDPEERNLGTRFDMISSNLKSSRTRNSGINSSLSGCRDSILPRSWDPSCTLHGILKQNLNEESRTDSNRV